MKIKLLLILIFLSDTCFSQNPLVKQWDKRYGGFEPDLDTSLILTNADENHSWNAIVFVMLKFFFQKIKVLIPDSI